MSNTASQSPVTNKPKRIKPSFASLSRNALYSTLKSYTTSQGSSSNTSNINNNVKEKSLYSFLEKVSIEYHSSTSKLGKLSGTNGGLPLRSRHMESKMAARALTLIGGGSANASALVKSTSSLTDGMSVIADDTSSNKFTSITNSRKKSNDRKRKSNMIHNFRVHGSLSNKKRKKLKEEQLKRIQNKDKSDGNNNSVIDCTAPSVTSSLWTLEILIGVNEIWNNYINKLLHPVFKPINNTHDNKLKCTDVRQREEISSLLSCAELIGANVLFHDKNNNDDKKKYKEGVIVNVTKNTWRIACCPKNGHGIMNRHQTKQGDDKKDNSHTSKEVWNVKIVPKMSYSLICVIQLQNSHNKNKKDPSGDNENSDEKNNQTKTLYVNITT